MIRFMIWLHSISDDNIDASSDSYSVVVVVMVIVVVVVVIVTIIVEVLLPYVVIDIGRDLRFTVINSIPLNVIFLLSLTFISRTRHEYNLQ